MPDLPRLSVHVQHDPLLMYIFRFQGNSLIRGPQDVVAHIVALAGGPIFDCAARHNLSFLIGGVLFPVDPHDFVLEHYDVEMADDDRFEAGDDDRRSASPSLQVSPRTFLHQRRDLFNLDDGASPLTTEAPAITTTIPVDSPLAPIVRPLLSVPWACSLTPSPAQ